MRKSIIAILMLLVASNVQAAILGAGSLKSCSDGVLEVNIVNTLNKSVSPYVFIFYKDLVTGVENKLAVFQMNINCPAINTAYGATGLHCGEFQIPNNNPLTGEFLRDGKPRTVVFRSNGDANASLSPNVILNTMDIIFPSTPITGQAQQLSSITASPSTVPVYGSVAVTFSNVNGVNSDWIAIHKVGTPDTQYVGWRYLNGTSTQPTGAIASGSVNFTMNYYVGQYNFILHSQSTGTIKAISNTITIQ